MHPRFHPTRTLVALTGALLATAAVAADPAGVRKVGFVPSGNASPSLLDSGAAPTRATATETGQYVFSAPPRESAQVAAEIYGPIAEYLSRVTGKQVVFRHSSNWIAYQTEMRRGDYDLVFDGPHFNSWRASHMQHNILVKAPGEHSFVVAVKRDNKVTELKQLTGRAICGMSPPNLGTLTVLKEFDNPMRQPIIQNTEGWDTVYAHLQAGRCAAAILPTGNLAKYDGGGGSTRVIFKARSFPSQAFSAGPRVAAADQAAIVRALTSPEARAATLRLRDAYALNGDLQPASKDEYVGVAGILKDSWGYQ
jgi:hypothetical protein